MHNLYFSIPHISLTISRLFQYAYNNISISPIPLIVKYYTILLSAEHKHRQYNDRKRPDTYDPVTVVCPVHLLFMLNSFHAFFELVIRLSFHKFSFLNFNCIAITFIDKYYILWYYLHIIKYQIIISLQILRCLFASTLFTVIGYRRAFRIARIFATCFLSVIPKLYQNEPPVRTGYYICLIFSIICVIGSSLFEPIVISAAAFTSSCALLTATPRSALRTISASFG